MATKLVELLIGSRPDLGPAGTPAEPIRHILEKIDASKARGMTRGMRAASDRLGDFPSPMAAMLTGIAIDPPAREYADSLLDEWWADQRKAYLKQATATLSSPTYRDVIIGSGYHAAVYAANRVLAGKPRPIVIERNTRAGGVFAMTDQPVFYLNSRNRAGGPGLAGDNTANLNYLPGAPIQASNMGIGEYQTNVDMAFVIRLTLAQYADVIVGTNVSEVGFSLSANRPKVSFTRDRLNTGDDYVSQLNAQNVIDARGLGDPKGPGNENGSVNGTSVVTFEQFMARMAQPWPLRGLRKIAIIGDGDSARCAIEAALGLGPEPFMAAAALDPVDRIDVYGPKLPDTCEAWEDRERGRYKRIGRYLRNDRYGTRQLNIVRRKGNVLALPGQVVVNSQSYDMVIVTNGHVVPIVAGLFDGALLYEVNGVSVARRDGRIYSVGPRANLPFTTEEATLGISDINSNKVSMFRLGIKTAALAATLPA